MYKRIKNLKAEINKKSKQSPGVVSRKPTLVEFCKYFDLPVDESSHILNNRFLERIIIAEGPFKNQPD